MPSVKPFQGTYYDKAKVKDISQVVCPPYDVISPKKLKDLQGSSGHNFIHALVAPEGDYKSIGNKFCQWIKDGLLVDDPAESFYLYEQLFDWEGKAYCRFGVLALLQMDQKGGVFPHENTLAKPKADRKKVIREVKANLSPIFVIVPKKLKALHEVYRRYSRKPSFFDFKDIDGVKNRLWKISDAKDVKILLKSFDKQKLVIADGHHRFEISYDYFKNNKGRFKDLNYLMAYVTDDQPGLLILPTHRVLSLKYSLLEVLNRLSVYFSGKKVSSEVCELALAKPGKTFEFGLYFNGECYLFELKDLAALNKAVVNPLFRKLDTFILHQFVLPMFDEPGEISYTHSIAEALKLAGKDKFAFLLKTVDLPTVFAIANKGYKFPQKSTYFYPKLLSGLVVRRFKK